MAFKKIGSPVKATSVFDEGTEQMTKTCTHCGKELKKQITKKAYLKNSDEAKCPSCGK